MQRDTLDEGADGETHTIALVVPAYENVGGVTAVALFIREAIARRPDLRLRIISLAMSSRDPCSVLISAPSTWLKGVRTREGERDGERFVHVGALLGEFEFQRLAKRTPLTRALDDCDLIQVVAGVPAWALPVVGLGKPVVLQVATLTSVERRLRSSIERGPLAWWRKAMTMIVSRLDGTALRRVDAVMVENPWMKSYVEEHTDPGQTLVRYAPPGVDTTVFHPAEADERDSGAYILSVGRFSDPRKNVTLLLEAYSRVINATDAAPNLVLAGASDPGEAFWSRAEELGIRERIIFHLKPSTEMLAKLYRDAVCFALASDEEGFGVVIVEAMSSGIPVVSTRSGGPDGIITDGMDGFLVKRGDATEMADRLILLLRDSALARRVGIAARETVCRRFERGVAGEIYLQTYDKLFRTKDTA